MSFKPTEELLDHVNQYVYTDTIELVREEGDQFKFYACGKDGIRLFESMTFVLRGGDSIRLYDVKIGTELDMAQVVK